MMLRDERGRSLRQRLGTRIAVWFAVALAVAGCAKSSAGGSAPDSCPRGKVIAQAETLSKLKAEVLRRESADGVSRIYLHEHDGATRIFEVKDQHGGHLDYFTFWQNDNGTWAYSRTVACQ